MLEEAVEFQIDDKWWRFDLSASGNYPLTRALEFWMAELAHEHLRLGVCFRALTIMLQIPGADEYTWDAGDVELPPVERANRSILTSVLVECLDRLRVKYLIRQLPELDYKPIDLPEEWQEIIEARAAFKNGLMTLIAQCLDELIVQPGHARIAEFGQQSWWHRMWTRKP
jgi:hypothetical protein